MTVDSLTHSLFKHTNCPNYTGTSILSSRVKGTIDKFLWPEVSMWWLNISVQPTAGADIKKLILDLALVD